VERELEIVTPVADPRRRWTAGWVVEENTEPIEIGAEAVEDDDVRRDDQKITRKRGVGLVEAVKETPRDEEREDLGLAGAGREFKHVAGQSSANMPLDTAPEASKRIRSYLSRARRTSWSQMTVSTASRCAK